ncbi:hypothetical protein K502DRAFT_111328 [Neoconidiobolus thromboides FSU 785]|nr:hypothetical protein K502DRAFT_111328 [Neoconidiobolus thromboides FSU 785]
MCRFNIKFFHKMGLTDWFKNSYIATHLEVGKYTKRRTTNRSNSMSDAEVIMNYIQKEVLTEQYTRPTNPTKKSTKKNKLNKTQKAERDLKAIEDYIGIKLFTPKAAPPKETRPKASATTASYSNSSNQSDFFQDNFVDTHRRSLDDASTYGLTKRQGFNDKIKESDFELGSSRDPFDVEFVDLDSYFENNQGAYHGK